MIRILFALVVLGCTSTQNDEPMNPVSFSVAPPIAEASGIVASKSQAGYLWVHEDGGRPTQLFLLKTDGSSQKKVFIQNISNNDWEDMTLVGDTIYLAGIGDNAQNAAQYSIWKFREPAAGVDTVSQVSRIRFQYSDGSYDAEAFLVDPATKDIYLITKRTLSAKIYKLSYPYSTTAVNTAVQVHTLPYTFITGAALSVDGKKIIIRTYMGLNYYTRAAGESLLQALHKSPESIKYTQEPQGEAVCFTRDGKGYYTLSEQTNAGDEQKLFEYQF